MPVRAKTLAAALAAYLNLTCAVLLVSPCQAQSATTLAAASLLPAADSLPSAPADPLAAARVAHQAAWAQRQAGDPAGAIRTIEDQLPRIEEALVGDLDANARRELVDLRGRMRGLRDAAARDATAAEAPQSQSSPTSEDPQVLTAPAIEDIEPQFNADVYRYIEYFTGAGRSVFERWLKRSGRYIDLFREVLQREGLPPDLVHLVFVESGFNVHARSYSAAVGPWQFLRSTARLFGLTVNQWVDERKDPEKSTVAAARYLRHLYSIFGDWPLALASYNAGEGAVLRAIKKQGTTNYWDLRLPQQTEQYVPQFMAVLAISRDPVKYGFQDVELEDPMDFDEVALRGAVDLRAIARLADCSYETMRDLNPAVLRHAAPGRDGVTTLRVPRGMAEVILGKLSDGASLPPVDLTVKHRVRRGETLQAIANQYHVDASRLARDNQISRQRPLKRGMVLTVRSSLKPGGVQVAQLDPDDPRGSTDYVPERSLKLPASLDAESDAEGRATVTVRRGETLQGIAKRYGVTVEDIRDWNHLKSTQVRRGTRLKIRTGDAALTSAGRSAADSAQISAIAIRPAPRKNSSKLAAEGGQDVPFKAVVQVKSGETLGQIASRHGTTVGKIQRANGLSSTRIRAGQKLKIPA